MTWESTLCFRRFRQKHTDLSKIYWTQVLGVDAIRSIHKSSSTNDYITDKFLSSCKRGQLPITVAEFKNWSNEFLGRVRLHILLVSAANLETYLKEITFVYLLSKGYDTGNLALNEIGKAIGYPILGKSTLPDPLHYAEKLFDVSYGSALVTWEKSYKLRCILAHSGGVATDRALRDLPSLGLQINKNVTISWKSLYDSLAAADTIAAKTDEKIASSEIKKIEVFLVLDSMKNGQKLPPRERVWEFLHKEYGLTSTKKQLQKYVYPKYYNYHSF